MPQNIPAPTCLIVKYSGGQRTRWSESALLGDRSANVLNLDPYINPYDYLRSTSDIVSLMVLEHQTRMTNLIVRLGYETRIAMDGPASAASLAELPEECRVTITKTAEELLRYMLFTDEALLEEPIHGAADFVRDFEAAGRRDQQGRSLRQLALDRRLMRYPCSYMVESAAFESLPAAAKEIVYGRLRQVLTGQDLSPEFNMLSADDRQAILEILLDTKSDLPSDWRAKSPG